MSSAQPGNLTKALIGVSCVLAGAAIIYFNAGTRLRCERGPTTGVVCTLGQYAFNQIPLQLTVLQDVRAIERDVGRTNTGTSGQGGRVVASLAFITPTGRVSPGYFADFFADNWDELDAFMQDGKQPDIVLERSAWDRLFGHVIAVFLALLGTAVVVDALRSALRIRR